MRKRERQTVRQTVLDIMIERDRHRYEENQNKIHGEEEREMGKIVCRTKKKTRTKLNTLCKEYLVYLYIEIIVAQIKYKPCFHVRYHIPY